MQPKKILVPVDFSPFSDYATDFAIYLSQVYKASITLFNVIVMYEADVEEESHVKQLEKIIQLKEKNTNILFDRHQQKFQDKSISINCVTTRGVSAANSILDFVNENDFDLIVMGTHGRTGLKNWIYGSITEKVVRLSPVPVLTIQNDPGKIALNKLIVPVDFSENSKKTIDEAYQIAKQFNAQLYFVHVVEAHSQTLMQFSGGDTSFKAMDELRQISSEKLKRICKRPESNAVFTVLEGKPYHSIGQYAEDIEADMIVISTRGFTGLDHLLIGSTTERVVRTAPCAVLTTGRSHR